MKPPMSTIQGTFLSNDEINILSGHLHENIGQELVCLKIAACRLSSQFEKEGAVEVHNQLNDMVRMVENVLERVRQINRFIRPRVLQEFGLVTAIENEVHELRKYLRRNVVMNTDVSKIQLSPETELDLFRIVQETIRVVSEQSSESEVVIKITKTEDLLRIGVSVPGVSKLSDDLSRQFFILKLKIKKIDGQMKLAIKDKKLVTEMAIPLYNNN